MADSGEDKARSGRLGSVTSRGRAALGMVLRRNARVSEAKQEETVVGERRLIEDPDAEIKPARIKAEVVGVPTITRDKDNNVTAIEFLAKAAFKGTITIKARGSVAAAYWSLTPGMALSLVVRDLGDREFAADSIDVVTGTA